MVGIDGYDYKNLANVDLVQVCNSTALLLMFFNWFYWIRLNESLAKYARVLIAIPGSVKYFFLLFLIIVLAFSRGVYVLNVYDVQNPLQNP